MIKNFCEFGLDIIVASVLERLFKNGVKTVDQRSPPVKGIPQGIILYGSPLSRYLVTELQGIVIMLLRIIMSFWNYAATIFF